MVEEHRMKHLDKLMAVMKELDLLRTVEVKVDWRIVRDAVFLTDAQFNAVVPFVDET